MTIHFEKEEGVRSSMKISDISIRNPVFAWMLMLSMILFGGIAFNRLGVSQMPDVDFPVLNVSVALDGAAPEVIETSIIDPLENSLMTVEGVRQISASAKTGIGNVTLEFELGKDINVALQEVQTKASQILKLLPKEAEAPIITKTNPDDQPILWLALTYERDDLTYLMKYARDYVRDRFTTIPGVGDLFLGGYTEPNLRVWVKEEELERRNIAVTDIIEAIKNEHIEMPGGSIDQMEKSYNVRTLGEAKTLPEFRDIPISRRAGQIISDPGQVVKLKDVAVVEEGLDDIRRISRFNGKIALGLGVRKQRGSNAVEVARGVKAKVDEIQKTLPEGMKLAVNFDSTRFIESSMHELNKHLVFAALLTALVCWMFLGSFSATINVLLSIPTSVMGTFLVLYFCNFTLNTFTLLGLTLSIGIIVDDAIMVLENIFRHHEGGKPRIDSAILGAREITFAAMAATLAVIAIFLPVAFMKGVIGKYFMQFGVTISVAVFLSLMESLTITPMRCSQFVEMGHRTTRLGKAFDAALESLVGAYERILSKTLDHAVWVLVASLVFLGMSFFVLKNVEKEMAPLQDQSIFLARLQAPVGSSLKATNEKLLLVEEWLRHQFEVRQAYVSVGGFTGGASDANTSMAFITLKSKEERGIRSQYNSPLSQQDFMDLMRKELKNIPNLKVMLQDLSMRGFSSGRGFPIEFVLKGPDWDKLHGIADKVMEEMKASNLMVDVDSNYLLGMPEIQIRPDRQLAAQRGVSVANIGTTVNALIGGVRVSQYATGGHRYDVRLKILTDKNADPMKVVPRLQVGNARSNLISLRDVTRQEVQTSLQQISRLDRQRAITVTAGLNPGASQEVAFAKVEEIVARHLVPEYFMQQTGGSKAMKESFQWLFFALLMGLIVAYMVLAAQFNSFIDPISILMALPFSLSGAFVALKLTHNSLNIYSFIGLLLLMGIVKKNSILLIEFTNAVRDQKQLDARESLRQACPVRLRPILMTSMATVAGAIPSAMAWGEGSETARPMAWTIIGGVIVSTILTLIVVPAVYLILDRWRQRDQSKYEIAAAFDRI